MYTLIRHYLTFSGIQLCFPSYKMIKFIINSVSFSQQYIFTLSGLLKNVFPKEIKVGVWFLHITWIIFDHFFVYFYENHKKQKKGSSYLFGECLESYLLIFCLVAWKQKWDYFKVLTVWLVISCSAVYGCLCSFSQKHWVSIFSTQ